VNFNPHMLMMVREMIGSDRMVLGSDYPHLLGSIERAVSSIETLNISDHERQQIFEGTALSILNNM
jgi:predicted TIM-barrel fold metal-dependent hydrolase